MLKFLPLILCINLISCVHFDDYVKHSEPLTEAGGKVNLASLENVDACQKQQGVLGKGQGYSIQEAVRAAIKNGQNRAGSQDQVNTLVYQRTEVFQSWGNHYIAIHFRGYECSNQAATVSQKTVIHSTATAEARKKIQDQAQAMATQANAQAAAHANSQAAAQAASDAAQAAQAASQAGMQQMFVPPPMF